jgi:hypothetical protein
MITRDAIADAIALALGRWRYRKATTLTDLAELRTRQLIREAAKLPAGDRRHAMFNALIGLGNCGVVVHDWRPGTSTTVDGTTMETRACLVAFVDSATKDALENTLYYAGKVPGARVYQLDHIFEPYGPGCEEYDRAQRHAELTGETYDDRNTSIAWVERINGTLTARIGGQMTPAEIYRAWPVRADLAAVMRYAGSADVVDGRAWLITICAPTWGDSRMWDDLSGLLPEMVRRQRAVAA